MFAKLRLSILSARLLARRCPPRHRLLPIRNRPHPAALIWQQARPRPVLLLPHPSRPQRKCSPPPLWLLFSACPFFARLSDVHKGARQITRGVVAAPLCRGEQSGAATTPRVICLAPLWTSDSRAKNGHAENKSQSGGGEHLRCGRLG